MALKLGEETSGVVNMPMAVGAAVWVERLFPEVAA